MSIEEREGASFIPSALGASVSISVQSNEKPERILRMLEGARIHAPKWNNKRARAREDARLRAERGRRSGKFT